MKKVNLLLLALLGLFVGACDSNNDTDGDWGKSTFEFSGSMRVGAVSFTDAEGNVYIGMGYNQDLKTADKNLRDFWKFNGSTWKYVADFPDVEGGRRGSVAFVVGDYAYVGAGFRASYSNMKDDRYFSDFYRYNLKTEKWDSVGGQPWKTDIRTFEKNDSVQCSFYSGVGFEWGGKGYVGTGQLDGRASRVIYCYDPATDSWSDAEFEGESRVGATTFTLPGKGVMLCLGVSGSEYRRDVWCFDGNWNKKRVLADVHGSMSDDYDEILRYYAASFVVEHNNEVRGYVAGGLGARNTKSCWSYNFEKDRWYEQTEFPNVMGLRACGVGFSLNGRGYITVGGSSFSSATTSSTWFFIPGVEEDDDNDYGDWRNERVSF